MNAVNGKIDVKSEKQRIMLFFLFSKKKQIKVLNKNKTNSTKKNE